MLEIILASKSKVRKEILDKNKILNRVEISNVDEDVIKHSLLKEKATPTIISKNLAELKANKVSQRNHDMLVLGADSVIDLDGELISKPKNREEALNILKKLDDVLFSGGCVSGSLRTPRTKAVIPNTVSIQKISRQSAKNFKI